MAGARLFISSRSQKFCQYGAQNAHTVRVDLDTGSTLAIKLNEVSAICLHIRCEVDKRDH